MKAGQSILALVFGGALSLAATAPLVADIRPQLTMKPLMAASLDAGSKHVVSYFLASGGQCRLTLMIADESREGDASPGESARLQVSVDAGKSARLDTAKGKALEFACTPDGRNMTANTVDRVATYRAAE